MKGLCIFEDGGYAGLLPLTYNRASYELRLGMYTLLERILQQYPGRTAVTLFVREYLADVLRERYPHRINTLDPDADGYLFINGRNLDLRHIPLDGKDEIGVHKETLVYARLSKENCQDLSPDFFIDNKPLKLREGQTAAREVEIGLADYTWDIVKSNRAELEKDCSTFTKGRMQGKVYDGVHILNPQGVFLGKGARVKPGCVLDAEKGPVYISQDAEIMPNAVIIGPAYVGIGSVILPGARLREGTNIGEGCKVGGEVSNSIIHSYSNKQHEGFLGDSYVGSWVNIGAGATTSNLKNTYGSVQAKLDRSNKTVDTKQMFFGSVIGDHTKIGINSSLEAGSHIGCHSNIAGRKPIPKYLPPFSFVTDSGQRVYNMRKAFIVASTAMSRREKGMSAAEEEMFRNLFALTAPERKGMKK